MNVLNKILFFLFCFFINYLIFRIIIWIFNLIFSIPYLGVVLIVCLYAALSFLIIGLFLYSKLIPYKNNLTGRYLSIYNIFHKIFNPILSFLKKRTIPYKVGNGIAIDLSPVILLALLIINLILLRFVL